MYHDSTFHIHGLIGVVEVSHLAGVTDTTVRKWMARKEAPYNNTAKGKGLSQFYVMLELISLGLPLLSLEEAVAQVGGDIRQAYRLNALGRMARIRLPNGNKYYTTFGVAKALGIKNPVYLTTTEAAALLGITRDSVANRIKRGDLPGIRMLGGFQHVVPADAITPVSTDGWLRVAEVAAMWNMYPSSINRMCKRNMLRSTLVGKPGAGYYLIDPTSVAGAPKRPIDTAELCRRTGLPKSTVELWRRKGKIRGARLGHNWRYPASEVSRVKRLMTKRGNVPIPA